LVAIAAVAFAVGVFAHAGCSGGTGAPRAHPVFADGGPPAVAQGRVVDGSGKAIAGVNVAWSGGSASTTNDGTFAANLGPAPAAVVSFDKDGFVARALRIPAASGASLAFVVPMAARAAPTSIDPAVGGTITGPRGAKLVLPAGALVDAAGKVLSGKVDVAITPLDWSIAAERATYPAGLAAQSKIGAELLLDAYGAIDVDLRQAGAPVYLQAGVSLALTVPASSVSPPDTATTYGLDGAAGVWREAGTAALDAGADVYTTVLATTAVARAGAWSVGVGHPPACVHGRVVANGQPVASAVVFAHTDDGAGGGTTIAAPDGTFCLSMAPSVGTTFDVRAATTDVGPATTVHVGGPTSALASPVYACASDCEEVGDVATDAAGASDASPASDASGDADGSFPGVRIDPACKKVRMYLASLVAPGTEACASTFGGFLDCVSPQGTCTENMAGSGGYVFLYENNAHVQWDASGTSASYWGSSLRMCGAANVTNTLNIMPNGSSEVFTVDPSGASVTVTCHANAASFMIPSNLRYAFLACLGLAHYCAMAPACETSCPSDRSTCCQGIAGRLCLVGEGDCAVYSMLGCRTDADCQATEVCCFTGQFNQCTPGIDCSP
jgi:hypothetical protein